MNISKECKEWNLEDRLYLIGKMATIIRRDAKDIDTYRLADYIIRLVYYSDTFLEANRENYLRIYDEY